MKKLTGLMAVVMLLTAGTAFAGGPKFFGKTYPILQEAPPPAPAEEGAAMEPMPAEAAPVSVALYHNVKYVDLDEMAPCAESITVQVQDPCWDEDDHRCCPQANACGCAAPAPCGCAAPAPVSHGCAAPVSHGCAAPVGCAAPAPTSCCAPAAPTSCCAPAPQACGCCAPPMVNVQICVPTCVPCGKPEIKRKKDGDVTYDYGDYEIDIRVKKGYIEVDYQD